MNSLLQNLIEKYAEKKILILGFGREGQSTYKTLRHIFRQKNLWVSDQQLEQLTIEDEYLHLKSDYVKNIDEFDVIFKTPGISAQLPELQSFLQQEKKITSQLNEFLEIYKEQTIGVTGTKGKSSTSSLIHHLLEKNGHESLLAGNIGVPVFEIVDDITEKTVIVVEMSSYQLEIVMQSPHIAVLLNLFPEHLNYHRTIDNYLQAKSHITSFQNAKDFLIFNEDVPEFTPIVQKTVAQTFGFSEKKMSEKMKEKLSDLNFQHLSMILKEHNVQPAFLVAQKCFGIPENKCWEALESFQALPHRVQNVGTYGGVTFIDDTLATIPEATSAAIESLPRIDAILLGGFDRGIEYDKVVAAVVQKKIRIVLLFKPSGEKMMQIFQEKYANQLPSFLRFVDSMSEAIQLVFEHVPKKGVVLLSPASPSFGQFKNYEDKSAQFLRYAQEHSQT